MKRLAILISVASLAAILASSAVASTTVTTRFPFTLSAGECGEVITASGTATLIVTTQVLHDGGLLLSTQLHTQQVTGTSSTGVTYHGTASSGTTDLSLPSGGGTATMTDNFQLVGTMNAPTFDVTEIIHITVTPSGEIAVSFSTTTITCR
jgi:hypothetical protein